MRRGIVIVGIVATAVAVGWGWTDKPAPVSLVNQAWTDRFPTGPKDEVNWLLFYEDEDFRLGIQTKASQYRLTRELFRWSRRSDRLALEYPQTNRRASVKARPYACDVEDWDLCLEVREGSAKRMFYSMKDWTVGHPDTPSLLLPDPLELE